MSDVKINHGSGLMELERGDGWYYKLDGIVGLEVSYEGPHHEAVVTVIVVDVSDRTLESVRVLRDSFHETTLKIETD